jgi:hypothetical protein
LAAFCLQGRCDVSSSDIPAWYRPEGGRDCDATWLRIGLMDYVQRIGMPRDLDPLRR